MAEPAEAPARLNCPLESGAGPCECDLPRCPVCGYTEHDARFHQDHERCEGEIPEVGA